MASDVVFPRGCGYEAKDPPQPCMQGKKKMICTRMEVGSDTMTSPHDDAMYGDIIDSSTGEPLEQAAITSAMTQMWECFYCNRPARFIADIDMFWAKGGMALLEEPAAPEDDRFYGLTQSQQSEWGDAFFSDDPEPKEPPDPFDPNYFDM